MSDILDSSGPTMFETHCHEMFEAFDEGFCIIEVIFEGDRPTDYRFLEVNRAFAEQTGLGEVTGKSVRTLTPDLEDYWFEIYGRVARTGKPERFGNRAEALGRDYDVYAFRVGEPEDHLVGVLFKDVTRQRQAEAALAALNTELEARISERTQEVRTLAAGLTLAEARERARLAQVLHDDLQQQLYAMGFILRDLRARPDTLVADRLTELQTLLDGAIATSRTTTVNLSPPVLSHEGLTEALGWLASDMASRFSLDVQIDAPDTFAVSDEAVRVLLFGLVRELLFNVVKHAGVDEAFVTARHDSEFLTLVVEDGGRGFDPGKLSAGGVGLSGVRRRLELFGGRLELEAATGKGTRAAIILPTSALS